MSQHVTLSPTAHNLLVAQKLIDFPKVKAFSIPAKATEAVAETPAKEAPVPAASAAPSEVQPEVVVKESAAVPENQEPSSEPTEPVESTKETSPTV